MTHGVLLAAGEASRFGATKQLVEFEGTPLVLRAHDVLVEANLIPVVVLGANADQVRAVLPEDTIVVVNHRWREGMGTSIATGVAAAELDGARSVVVFAADTPEVTPDDITRLVEARKAAAANAAAAAYDDVVGIPACFDARLFPKLKSLGGDRGARAFLRRDDPEIVTVQMPSAARDIDRPSDLEGQA